MELVHAQRSSHCPFPLLDQTLGGGVRAAGQSLSTKARLPRHSSGLRMLDGTWQFRHAEN